MPKVHNGVISLILIIVIEPNSTSVLASGHKDLVVIIRFRVRKPEFTFLIFHRSPIHRQSYFTMQG